MEPELQKRIAAARAGFAKFSQLFRTRNVRTKDRIRIFKSIVLGVLVCIEWCVLSGVAEVVYVSRWFTYSPKCKSPALAANRLRNFQMRNAA